MRLVSFGFAFFVLVTLASYTASLASLLVVQRRVVAAQGAWALYVGHGLIYKGSQNRMISLLHTKNKAEQSDGWV